MEMWLPRIECPSITNKDELDFNNDTINNRLTYRADQGKWGLQLRYGDHEIFHSCNIDAVIPDTVSDIVRPCKPAIKDCAFGYNNTDVSFFNRPILDYFVFLKLLPITEVLPGFYFLKRLQACISNMFSCG